LLQGVQAELMTQTLYSSIRTNATTNDQQLAESRRQMQALASLPENSVCADCNGPNPAWISINLGVFLCIECGGVHRRLGTHVSQVRSTTLDVLKPETIQQIRAMGNNMKLNKEVYETAERLQGLEKITPDANPEQRERYIRAKYESHKPAAK